MRTPIVRKLVILSTIAGCSILYIFLSRLELRPLLNRLCSPQHQVAFIKLHKVGGTTVQNIIQRFGERNKLLAAIPKKRNVLGKGFRNVVKIPDSFTFNLFYSHAAEFNRELLSRIMHKDTIYFSIFREPLSQFVSSFYYFKQVWRLPYLEKIPKDVNPLEDYLLNPAKYEPPNASLSHTNNRMSFDLGLPEMHFRSRSAIEKWLLNLDTKLDFVLITEHFNQSLVMLKRQFCWELQDVLYVSKNVNLRKPIAKISPEMLQAFRKHFMADVLLYNYTYARFRKKLTEQSSDFSDEVIVFEGLLNEVDKYCSVSYEPEVLLLPRKKFPRTKFSPSFNLTPWDCKLMYLREIDFFRRTRKKQNDLLFMKDLEDNDEV